MKIHVEQSGKRLGPYRIEEINDHLASGFLNGNDLAWYEGLADWTRLGMVPGVIGGGSLPPPLKQAAVPIRPAPSSSVTTVVVILGAIFGMVFIGSMLAAIAIPNFIRARQRAHARLILADLRLIDRAIDQYAIESNLRPGSQLSWNQVKVYIDPAKPLYSTGAAVIPELSYSELEPFVVDGILKTPVGTKAALGSVAEKTFWSPFILQ